MAISIVYSRFLLGFSPEFPFHRIAYLGDEELNNELQAIRLELWNDPKIRDKYLHIQQELEERKKQFRAGWVAKPGDNTRTSRVQESKGHGTPKESYPTGIPSFHELASIAQWKHGDFSSDIPPHGITKWFPLREFSNEEDSHAVVEVLVERTQELISAVYDKDNWNDEDSFIEAAPPQFKVVPGESLSRPKLVLEREKIRRLKSPAEATVTKAEGILRFYLTKWQPILEQFEESFGDEASGDQSHTRSRDEPQYVFELDGEIRNIRFLKETGKLMDYEGFKHLAELLSAPFRPRTGLELKGQDKQHAQGFSQQPAIDASAKSAYETKLRELAAEIDRARIENDPGLSLFEDEFNSLMEHFKESIGIGGRARNLASDSPENKAFESVKKNIKRSWKNLEKAGLGELVSHLKKCVSFVSPTIIYIPSYDPLHPTPSWKI